MARMDYVKANIDLLKTALIAVFVSMLALAAYNIETRGENIALVMIAIVFLSILGYIFLKPLRRFMNELENL